LLSQKVAPLLPAADEGVMHKVGETALEITNLIFISLLILLIVAVYLWFKSLKLANDEKLFWRFAALEMSDKAFYLLNEIKETAIHEIEDGNIDIDAMPFIFIGGITIAQIENKEYEGDFDFIDKSAYEQYENSVQTITRDCSRFGYTWLNERDSEYILRRSLKNA